MRKLLVGVAVLCLLAPTLALGVTMGSTMTPALVVSVDLKARSMTFKFTISDRTNVRTATWNEKTKWIDETAGENRSKPATVDLVKSLKEGSKVYVKVEDGVFTEVTAMSPTARL